MKKIQSYNLLILLACISMCTSNLCAKSISLNITQPSTFITKRDLAVKSIKVSGVVNKKTIYTLFTLYPNVENIDLLNTKIVSFTDENKVFCPKNEMPAGAFSKKQKLKLVILPRGAVKIGQGAFWSCTNLEKIVLPGSLQVIDKFAFQLCSRLKQITLPKSVIFLGGASFANCESLLTIACMSKTPPLMPEWSPFSESTSNNCIIYVPVEAIKNYKEIPFLKSFKIHSLNK